MTSRSRMSAAQKALKRKIAAELLFAASALALIPYDARAVQTTNGPSLALKRWAPQVASPNPSDLIYGGGPVIPVSTTYAIFWGKPSDFPRDLLMGVDELFGGMDGSKYLEIVNQYMLGAQAHTHFGGNLFDESPAPPTTETFLSDDSALFTEVCQVLTNNGMQPDPTAVYALFTSTFPQQAYYCGFHDYRACPDGTVIHVAYSPNSEGIGGCSDYFPPYLAPNHLSRSTQAITNVAAHEFMETITDPNLNAWIDANGFEVGDTCSYRYLNSVQLDSRLWKLQMLWSNSANGCAQGGINSVRILGAVSGPGTVRTFDIPGAAFGVFSSSINRSSTTVGYYTDASITDHGFMRTSNGTIVTMDPPGTTSGAYNGSYAVGVNATGTVAGDFADVNGFHGYVWTSNGGFTSFDVPSSTATVVSGISDAGAIVGHYDDAGGARHGFVRDPSGTMSTFDPPGTGNGGTEAVGINKTGSSIGHFTDANSKFHGFVRSASGAITTFDAPNAAEGTFPTAINDEGRIAGYYSDALGRNHGFIRDQEARITTFDAPAAAHGTLAQSINTKGDVAGVYSDVNGISHGFVRYSDGTVITSDALANSINSMGITAGYYLKEID
jgi:hypothetical protein